MENLPTQNGSRCVIDIHPRQTRKEPPLCTAAWSAQRPALSHTELDDLYKG
jgi:hypothetical protein